MARDHIPDWAGGRSYTDPLAEARAEITRLRALLAEARPLLWQHTLAPPRNTLLTRIDAALEGCDG